jgi:hypothetical protein
MNLRKYAQGKPCQIRLPGCIDSPGHETTVLCHWRDSSTGMGQKENDLLGAWGCHSCHAVVDGRNGLRKWTVEHGEAGVKLAMLEAVLRTQKELVKAGIIKW